MASLEKLFFTYPILDKIKDKTLIILEEDNKRYINSDKITIDNREYSIEFINDFLNNSRYFDFFNNFTKKQEFFTSFVYEDNIFSNAPISKIGFLEAIVFAEKKGLLKLTNEGKDRLEKLLKETNIKDFLNRYENRGFSYSIDEKNVVVPFSLINDFLLMTEKETESFFKEKNIPFDIGDLKIEEYAYVIRRFIADHRINNRYNLPGLNTKYSSLLSYNYIDYESLNKYKDKVEFLEDVNLNKDLKNQILKNMPSDLSLLEKAIYTYIKLCKTLTYDEEFYVFDQSEEIAIKHKDIKHIEEITPKNNRVVCYEFNAIYAKILSELGINLETKERKNKNFSGDHVNLSFRCGKYLIKADSVTAIFESDMTRAKLNHPLQGLTCINNNKESKEKFREEVLKIQKLINEQENINVDIKRKESFEEIVSRYGELVKPRNKMSIDEKLKLLIRELKSADVEGIDNLAYAYDLSKIMFNNKERIHNVVFNRMRMNNILFDENKALPILVITTNKADLREYPYNNKYYIYIPNQGLLSMSKDEISLILQDKKIEYIKEDHESIPGLRKRRG